MLVVWPQIPHTKHTDFIKPKSFEATRSKINPLALDIYTRCIYSTVVYTLHLKILAKSTEAIVRDPRLCSDHLAFFIFFDYFFIIILFLFFMQIHLHVSIHFHILYELEIMEYYIFINEKFTFKYKKEYFIC